MSDLNRATLDRTLPERFGAADWDEVLRSASAGRERRGRRLVGVVAALLVLVVGTASAFGTARDLLAPNEHIGHHWIPSKGKQGSFAVDLRNGSSTGRSWRLVGAGTTPEIPRPTETDPGQYAHITGGGRRIVAGGHGADWYARVFGVVSRPGGTKQRVLITFKGQPNGVFVLTPLEPGALKRDSGTQHSFGTG